MLAKEYAEEPRELPASDWGHACRAGAQHAAPLQGDNESGAAGTRGWACASM